VASRGINKVILVGNIGQDPETRYMPNGAAVSQVSLATSETWKDKSTGENQERTEWHRVVFYNRLAEVVGEYVRKRSKLYVEGQLRTRSWEQDGVKRYATEIIASEMQMLDGRGGEERQTSQQPPQARSQGNADAYRDASGGSRGRTNHQDHAGRQPTAPPNMDGFDDDIPF